MKVLVLHGSALHLGFLGCYGNTWVATPNLDSLAAESVVFDQHFAEELTAQPDATPPILPILDLQGITAEWVSAMSEPGAQGDAALEYTLAAALTSLEKLFAQDRWLCWVDLPSLQPPWHLSQDQARCYLGGAEEESWEPLLQPTLGPIHPDDLELWERLRCTYAAAVDWLDSGVGLLCDALRQRGWLDELMLVFTADRGLGLGEHGIIGDVRPWLHEEVVHLPLLIRQPGALDAGRRSFALTQPADLLATLLDWLQVGMPSHLQGQSLGACLRGDTDVVRAECRSHWMVAGIEEWALRTNEWAFLLPGPSPEPISRGPQLYVKPDDRWEVNNVVQHHQELAEELEKKWRASLG
jgi:arylsulfatase A-like enzyme